MKRVWTSYMEKAVRTYGVLFLLISALCMCRLLTASIGLNAEFLGQGVLTKDLIDGLKANIFFYTVIPYLGGSTVIGVCAVPFFLLWGDGYFSLYSVALVIPIVTLVLIYSVTRRFWGTSAAALTGFLYVCMPPEMVKAYGCTIGTHSDVIFYFMAVAFLMSCILLNPKKKALYYGKSFSSSWAGSPSMYFFFMGLISGVSSYACISGLGLIGLLAIAWIYVDRLFWKRVSFYWGLFGFIIGIIPIFLKIYYGFNSFVIPMVDSQTQYVSVWNIFTTKSWHEVGTTVCLMLYSLVNMGSLEKAVGGPLPLVPRNLFIVLTGILMIIVMCASIVHAIQKRKEKHHDSWIRHDTYIIFIGICIFTCMGAYVLHPLVWPFSTYLIPVYPLCCILIGVFVGIAEETSIGFIHLRSVAWVGCALFIVCGSIFYYGTVHGISFPLGNVLHTIKGYSLESAGKTYHQKAYGDFLRKDLFRGGELVNSELRKFPQISALYSQIIDSGKMNYSYQKQYAFIQFLPVLYRHPACFILGLQATDSLIWSEYPLLWNSIKEKLDAQYLHSYFEGSALSYCNRFYAEIRFLFTGGVIERIIPENYRHYFYFEYGRRVAEKEGDYADVEEISEHIPTAWHGYLLHGYGSFYRENQGIYAEVQRDENAFAQLRNNTYSFHRGVASGELLIKEPYAPISFDGEYNEIRLWGIGYGFVHAVLEKDNRYGISELGVAVTMEEIIERLLVDRKHYGIKEQREENDLWRGIGMGMGMLTYGGLSWYIFDDAVLGPYTRVWYEGYGMAIAYRYGKDKKYIQQCIQQHIPVEKQSYVQDGVMHWSELMNEPYSREIYKGKNNG